MLAIPTERYHYYSVMMNEAKLHQRIYLQTCQGSPTPETLRTSLLSMYGNQIYADACAAELELAQQVRKLENAKHA